ncbi:helix-turn-helix domain-containing protein [Virgibacillus sp. AGTR]|uniref:Tetratricopeptide repeat protein n=1 Tax=Virgibacillus salarius TaxID=447199 RepID=A0A941DR49_9BACI|nr:MULTISPECIES: helix-turn-helix domain-containing protein [Bacillaceae]NAZ08187.1 tetratricopeptide repeat protein [Agaribacter marinus]MBR7795474.1 tetratricopeptide repeat protein [Virgibacillus salarius]MCC2250471.1 helix-turn-helix domain-containing protein [Virgibacillus sp. AGTR]MDY7043525.1 helix-turn-helix domain-containing protein [Virgibacillus sp. M23]QRZ19828.1 tetratricopeptide repeat protein [Virgibacillus sp. AGTR]
MIEIGPFIKLQRTKQEMTQGELAEGIVSLSYLSKIENKKTDASPEIIQLLCNRLGIELIDGVDTDLQKKCKQWYAMLFDVYDKKEIIDTYKDLQALMDRSINDSFFLFEIHKIRYYIILRQIDKALSKMNELSEMVNSFDNDHLYYWYKFKGNYYSFTGEFNQAMRLYKMAEDKINQVDLDEEEVADLHYTISVTNSKLRNTLEVIDYANKAMDVFQRNYNFIRCAQCHILLGISYRRIDMYDKAIKNYNLAKHLGELNKNKQVIQLANLNLGYAHSKIGNTEEAIKYYVFVIEEEDDEAIKIKERLASITSLIKEYYNIGDYEKTKEMIKKALTILDLASDDHYYQLYYYIIHTYTYALNNEQEKFRALVTDEFIPYLKQHDDHSNLVVYAKMLGSHFEKLGKYKESVKYYKLANSAYNELINL